MLTKEQFDDFKKGVEKVLTELAGNYGADVICGKFTPDGDNFDLSVKIVPINPDGKSFEQSEFERYCDDLGFSADDYKKKFRHNGTLYTIFGINLKAKSMNVLTINSKGEVRKFKSDFVKQQINKSDDTSGTPAKDDLTDIINLMQ